MGPQRGAAGWTIEIWNSGQWKSHELEILCTRQWKSRVIENKVAANNLNQVCPHLTQLWNSLCLRYVLAHLHNRLWRIFLYLHEAVYALCNITISNICYKFWGYLKCSMFIGKSIWVIVCLIKAITKARAGAQWMCEPILGFNCCLWFRQSRLVHSARPQILQFPAHCHKQSRAEKYLQISIGKSLRRKSA